MEKLCGRTSEAYAIPQAGQRGTPHDSGAVGGSGWIFPRAHPTGCACGHCRAGECTGSGGSRQADAPGASNKKARWEPCG